MLYFSCDYAEGAHPKVFERLCELNMLPLPGYGEDEYCAAAKEKIRRACGGDGLEVWFLTGGTQTNQVVISTVLRRYEGVVATVTGHVNAHEAGAIEYTGHKVLALEGHDGKLDARELEKYVEAFYADGSHTHMVFPGMVYISHPTEYGTLYSKAELAELSRVCRRFELPLYLDGARLGYALASPESDVTLADIAALCDVFYIGGTKVGALCGEAVVFTRRNTPRGFLTMTKQQGAMLAKGRLLGMQFDALFTDGLYFSISRRAVELAMELKAALVAKGYPLFVDSPTNQQFVVLTPEQLERLGREVVFSVWEPLGDGRTVVRFATSWATREEDVRALIALL